MSQIKFTKNDETIALVQALASKDRNVAYEAQLALAAFVGPLMSEFSEKARTLSNLFTVLEFDADDSPEIPVDLYYDVTDEKEVSVWSQTSAGGLATNLMVPRESVMKFHTNDITSAWSFENKHVRRSRLDVVGKTFTKIMQELMIYQDTYSAQLLLGTLADNEANHVIDSTQTGGRFLPHDLNRLITKAKRIDTAWNGGTPLSGRVGPTDLILSPERMEDIREMAYNPVNTKDSDGTVASGADSGLNAPDSVREQLWGAAGAASFWGYGLMELLELGPSQNYTNVYDGLTGGTFNVGDDLVLAIDRNSDGFLRAVNTDVDTNAQFSVEPDDQFVMRQKKTGFVGSVTEGRMVLKSRALMGVRVQA